MWRHIYPCHFAKVGERPISGVLGNCTTFAEMVGFTRQEKFW
jgi:hypothetical protein